MTIAIETTLQVVGCGACGTRAESQDRMAVELRDLACFGRPARLVWRKRRWRCRDADCETKTWTETSPQFSAPAEAATLLDKAIIGCARDDVEEVRALGRTLESWRGEILAHHDTGASNGPTEGLNLCVKRVKRCGFGMRRFEHYRLRVLLHAGGVS